jgi:ABC-type transport system substrate-binding protein
MVTAEDIAFSMNDAGADNNQSAHDDGGEFADMWDRWEAIDDYTVRAPVDTWRFNSILFSLVQGASGFAIFSKNVYDTVGAEAAVTTPIGTGPFSVNEWLADERVELEAVQDHWRQTPGFARVTVLEVPENSTRVAMLATRQAQIGTIPIKDIATLKEQGFIDTLEVGTEVTATVNFSGNYWQKETPDGVTEDTHGPLFPRPGFHPDADHPWIGDPDDPDQFERARKFRWGLSLAIDRAAINTAILEGLGTVWYTPWVPPDHPSFDPKWVLPYDRDLAKQYLTEAGYPECLEFTFFIPPDSGRPPAVGEAVAQMWRNIGCEVQIENTSYSVRRPTEVNREIDIPWLFGCGGRPLSLDQTLDPIRFSQPGWNHGIEASFYHEMFLKQAKEPDPNVRVQNAVELNEYDWHNMPCTPVVGVPTLLSFRPDSVQGWAPHREDVTEAAINNLETAFPVR